MMDAEEYWFIGTEPISNWFEKLLRYREVCAQTVRGLQPLYPTLAVRDVGPLKKAGIEISLSSNELSLSSTMSITQRGNELSVTTRQDSTSSNHLEVLQSGLLDIAMVQQSGTYNKARVA